MVQSPNKQGVNHCESKRVYAREAKVVTGMANTSDTRAAQSLNRLQRTATLPRVWYPPRGLRDQREPQRTRMLLV